MLTFYISNGRLSIKYHSLWPAQTSLSVDKKVARNPLLHTQPHNVVIKIKIPECTIMVKSA